MTVRTSGRSSRTRQPGVRGMPMIDSDALAGEVLGWGVPRLRDLPWRAHRDPWIILVAEVMLQQTQVDRVIPKWREFIGLFPDPAACAAAPLGDVLRCWHGLGYPRRARYLHEAAGRVVELGAFPDTLEGLLSLSGVGAYTARALLAFAFEREAAVVDTNTARILARVSGERLSPSRAQYLAESLVPSGDAWRWNQVFMDLGAEICRPNPQCETCPISQRCEWRRRGNTGPDPAEGSAGVSRRQTRFEGSDRQVRGRIMDRLVRGACGEPELVNAAGCDPERLRRLVDALEAERLITRVGTRVMLPG